MNFASLEFLIFLTAFVGIYFCTPQKWRVIVITIFSIIFYLLGERHYFYLIFLVGFSDYCLALWMENQRVYAGKLLLLSWLKNILLLVFFKYDPLNYKLSLPLGLSFFTFQSLSYVTDTYKKKIKATSNLWTFTAYLMMFPQLVAGPICRAGELISQIKRPRNFDWDQTYEGICLIVMGLFKKVVIADYLAVFVAEAFNNVDRIHRSDYWILAILAFGVQIYFDFMAYTDIARGVGKIIGIELPCNFLYPYFARSLTDFWRRWHITLSTWFRDYVYIPLGGKHNTKTHYVFVLILTLVFSGAWHGGNYTFILWGLFHGVCLAVEKLVFKKTPTSLLSYAYTLLVVFIGWILFRSDDLSSFMKIIQHIIRFDFTSQGISLVQSFPYIFVVLTMALFVEVISYMHDNDKELPVQYANIFYAFLLVVVVTFYSSSKQFIYFRF